MEDVPPLPDDLAQALDETGARGGWEAYPAEVQRDALAWIEAGNTTAKRSKRIDDVARSAGKGQVPAALQ